jgi:hypothetical protein
MQVKQDAHEQSSHLKGQVRILDNDLDSVKVVHVLQVLEGQYISVKTQFGWKVNECEKVTVSFSLELSVVAETNPVSNALVIAWKQHICRLVGLHSHRHHQERPRVVVHQHYFHNIVLVVQDLLSVATADGLQKLDQLSVSVLNLAEMNDLLDNWGSNLDFKQLLVVVHQRYYSVFSTYVIDVVCAHRMPLQWMVEVLLK